MGRVSTIAEYGARPTILFHPDGWSAFPVTLPHNDPLATEGIVKAGTIWPANDATARGVILHDVNVAAGPAEASIVYAGDINAAKFPTAPSAEAKSALPRVTFFGATGTPGGE